MAQITAALVKELREKTNAGMMDCKEALGETDGDLQAAEEYLRKKGIADSSKKASRAAKEGSIAAHIGDGAQLGALIEVNCETDFVAKNENFQGFVAQLIEQVTATDATDVEGLMASSFEGGTLEEFVGTKISELGENLVVRRFERFVASGTGVVASYIHMAGKIGVLIEVGCGKEETKSSDAFTEVVKDLTLHVAAAAPTGLSRDDIPAEVVAKEKEIFAEQMKDKPENVIEKIVAGKLDKFFATSCFLEQGFIKDPDQTINELLAAKGEELGDTLEVRRFVRFAVGEEI